MAYASQSGRAYTDPSNPRAFGVCMRCGLWWNRDRLTNQHDWRGAAIKPLYIWVCPDCLDTPQNQLQAIAVPADPVPVYIPLTEPFVYDEAVQPGQTGPYGAPVGLQQYGISPLGTDGNHYGVLLPVLSVISNNTTTIQATCSAPHGLAANAQISTLGLSQNAANGFFSVNIVSATVFSYVTFSAIPAGSLLTGTSRIVTALVGLPYGYNTIPQAGP